MERTLKEWIAIGRAARERLSESLTAKLISLVTLVMALTSVFTFVYFPSMLERQAMKSLSARADGIVTVASHGLQAAVVFEDSTAMHRAFLNALRGEDVLHIGVFRADGMFLGWHGAYEDPPLVLPPDGLNAEGSQLTAIKPILFNDRIIAYTFAALSAEAALADVGMLVVVVQGLSLVILVIGLLAIYITGQVVLGPLREMVQTTVAIADGDLAVRAPVRSNDEIGQLAQSFNAMLDRLEAMRAAVDESRAQFEQTLDALPGEIGVLDGESRYLYVNPAAIAKPERRNWIVGRTPDDYWRVHGVNSGMGLRTQMALERTRKSREPLTVEEHVVDVDGRERHLICVYSPMVNDEGEVDRLVHYFMDVTSRWEAEQALHEREEQLLHAQKMEAIGRLAGGVAHDFNNVLTAIGGYASLIARNLDDEQQRADLAEIEHGVERAAGLTRQLLAFSRKQTLEPKPLDVNGTVQNLQKMLRRLISEDVALSFTYHNDIDRILADAGQLEQVIINLVVNARDAMPDGGTLSIDTGIVDSSAIDADDVAEGPYVCLNVRDSGVGMSEETRQHIFEPFFTTKGVGVGTGLGLATVYGVVQQSGGYITVESAVGVGTVFHVYFPSHSSASEALAANEANDDGAWDGGSHTVLIVEDEESLLNLATRVLEHVGYTVLSARGPEMALDLVNEHEGPIDLVLTDVVMPGMSGPELVDQLTAMRPEALVMYMSGYTDDLRLKHQALYSDKPLLDKPFKPEQLIRVVGEQLAGHRQSGHAA